jgi:ABC-type branched-subunit amino acid transport system substrate-binding protein
VRIAAHAPVTGAAPLPAPAFEEASDLYYKWYTEVQGNELLGGRDVEVTFANDQYQPSTAAQVCRQLMQTHFMLFGAGGTDQIQTCARIAERGSTPYYSAGVTETGLRGLEWYWAFSMSYKAQGRLLAQYVDREYGDRTAAAIITDTANFDDAVEGWEAGVAQQGLDYYDTLRHPRGDTG